MTTPTTLGRHTLLRRLAAGGMGEVYLAEVQGAAGFSRRVAIKRILPHLARDEDFVRKFIDEANIMVQLHHGNIVGVQELADHDGELYIVMDYLPGRDLKAVIHRLRQRRMTMPPELALWLTTEICAALDYAHRKLGPDGQPLHIVHRDVSPSNIVLGAAGEVKLLDFGIARARGRLHQSVSGTLQGKFVYMSPEQADGRAVDPRSDVFSAGLVLYELLTGTRPLEGESETETLRLVRQARIPPPSSQAELDPAVDALVLGALAVEPDERYASAADMRRALLTFLSDRRSLVDARSLGEFLASLFPEGVVPSDAPDPPLSFDDALQLQLGALTPSIDPMTRTRTGEPQGPTPTPAPAERTPTPLPATQAVVLPPVSPRGIKRVLTLGVVLGALLASGVTLWWARRGEASLAPQVEGPAEYEVRVNGGPVAASARFPVGEPLRICVQAEDYVEACRSLPLARGENRPVFQLHRVPTLVLDVEPAGSAVEATASGLPVDRQPYPLLPGKPYRVCLERWPTGLEPEGRCQTIERAEQGEYRLRFRLVAALPPPVPPDAAVTDAAPPDAGV
ncbi:MAG: serine/threonine protein kinase, partial [Myxococcales bacterium]|nr:serine/threonine protein kinase [Myxococcales bacterium]